MVCTIYSTYNAERVLILVVCLFAIYNFEFELYQLKRFWGNKITTLVITCKSKKIYCIGGGMTNEQHVIL